MNMGHGQEDTVRHELVIIRARGGGEDAPHKGGVWKIAYADFMTAMMAFFLVMWLINATDEKTLTQVATYFNPIRLSDKATSPKGLHAMDSNSRDQEDPKQQTKEHSQQSRSSTKSDQGKSQHSEDVIFSDPYGTLTKIAAQAEQGPIRSTVGSPKQGEASMTTGEAYRDPFDPQFRQEVTARGGQVKGGNNLGQQSASGPPAAKGQPSAERQASAEGQSSAEGKSDQKDVGQSSKQGPATSEGVGAKEPIPAAPMAKQQAAEKVGEQTVAILNPEQRPDLAERAAAKEPAPASKDQPTPARSSDAAEATPSEARLAELNKLAAEKKIAANQKDADQLEKQIEEAIDTTRLKSIPNIEVKSEAEGVLISLTDQFDFGMFAISSIEPKPEMVVVMEKIAGILASRSESIIVRGHTDGRPFKSKTYDNWRLSTARAHMAYLMLTRGGINVKRIERIEGFADQQLKVPSDPGAASNRRIEILLRKGAP